MIIGDKFTFNNVCCIIVTFNPGSDLHDLVDQLQKQSFFVIIVDNSTNKANREVVLSLTREKVVVFVNGSNKGIAHALNLGIREARKLDFRWVITFDQDSRVQKNILPIFNNVYASFSKAEKIGAIGLNFIDNKGDIYKPVDSVFLEKHYLITSGCLTLVKAFEEVEGFDETLFIDNVDIDFSLKLKQKGYKLLLAKEPAMFHSVGNQVTKYMAGIQISSSNHSALRRYYMSRNHIILSKRFFFEEFYFVCKMNCFFLLAVIKMLIIERQRFSKLRYSIEGIIDGLFNSKAFQKKIL